MFFGVILYYISITLRGVPSSDVTISGPVCYASAAIVTGLGARVYPRSCLTSHDCGLSPRHTTNLASSMPYTDTGKPEPFKTKTFPEAGILRSIQTLQPYVLKRDDERKARSSKPVELTRSS